jgi:hypothetical protein
MVVVSDARMVKFGLLLPRGMVSRGAAQLAGLSGSISRSERGLRLSFQMTCVQTSLSIDHHVEYRLQVSKCAICNAKTNGSMDFRHRNVYFGMRKPTGV